MSVAELENRLRALKMADPEPGIAARAFEALRLKRHLRLAWSAAAAALLAAALVGRTGSPAPASRVVEVEGVRRIAVPPSPRAVRLAFAERKGLETRLLEGGLR